MRHWLKVGYCMTERDALDVARVLLKKAGQDEALVRKIGSDTDIGS